MDFVHARAGHPTRLLPSWAEQLAFYTPDLLQQYRDTFGDVNVRSAPVEDYHLCDHQTFDTKILPFLIESDETRMPTVVHCSGGSGRTGHVLAAWLVRRRGVAGKQLSGLWPHRRNPFEAVQCGNATKEQLHALLKG